MSEVSLIPDEIRIAGSGYSHVALFRHVLEGHLIPSKFQESNSQVQFNRVFLLESHVDGMKDLFEHIDYHRLSYLTSLSNSIVIYTLNILGSKNVSQLNFLRSETW